MFLHCAIPTDLYDEVLYSLIMEMSLIFHGSDLPFNTGFLVLKKWSVTFRFS